MDHQQNYVYSDPSTFGFINSFTGSENYMQQQLNGSSQDNASSIAQLQDFESGNVATPHFMTEPPSMLYHLPNTLNDEPSAHYSPGAESYHVAQSELSLNSQKDQIFNLDNTNTPVTSGLIQLPDVAIVEQHPMIAQQPSQHLLASDAVAGSLSTSLSTDPVVGAVQSESIRDSNAQSEPTEALAGDQQKKCIFSPEQNSMMKALGVMRREVLAPLSGSKKRRRRILQLNEDDSDDGNELKKELLVSPEKDKEKKDNDDRTGDSSLDSDSDDPPENDPEALKARFLLKSAVIIQGPDSKKRKKRVLESDEEEMQTSVDDIGLMSNENEENDEEMFVNDIVVSEPVFENLDDGEKVVPIENPIILQDDFVTPAKEATESTEGEKTAEKHQIVKKESDEGTSSDPGKLIKTEDNEIDPSMSVEAILENIKPMADDE